MHIDDSTVRRPILGVPWRPPTRVGIILFGVVCAIYFADLLVSAVKLWPGIAVEPGHDALHATAAVTRWLLVCLLPFLVVSRLRADWRLVREGRASAIPGRRRIALDVLLVAVIMGDLLLRMENLWPWITEHPAHQPYRLFAVVVYGILLCLIASVWLLRARAQWRLSDGAASACGSGNGTPDATPPAA